MTRFVAQCFFGVIMLNWVIGENAYNFNRKLQVFFTPVFLWDINVQGGDLGIGMQVFDSCLHIQGGFGRMGKVFEKFIYKKKIRFGIDGQSKATIV